MYSRQPFVVVKLHEPKSKHTQMKKTNVDVDIYARHKKALTLMADPNLPPVEANLCKTQKEEWTYIKDCSTEEPW